MEAGGPGEACAPLMGGHEATPVTWPPCLLPRPGLLSICPPVLSWVGPTRPLLQAVLVDGATSCDRWTRLCLGRWSVQGRAGREKGGACPSRSASWTYFSWTTTDTEKDSTVRALGTHGTPCLGASSWDGQSPEGKSVFPQESRDWSDNTSSTQPAFSLGL